MSPLRKQTRQETSCTNDQANGGGKVPELIKHLEARIDELFDRKISEMQACIKSLLTTKLNELEKKLNEKVEAVMVELQELKDDYNQCLYHVDQDSETKIAAAWEHAVQNEQYSRKHNVRIFGVSEDPEEHLEEKVITLIKDKLDVEVEPEEIDVIHRVGKKERSTRNMKPRAVIVKFSSNKAKMKVLMKRKHLKGRGITIAEDMAPDLAKRLKELNNKTSVERAWLVNGKIRYI